MIEARFIQIHWLASYPGALLNRDDAGMAKSLPFGGVSRTRISSQCLKRRWREAKDAMNIGLIENVHTGQRSREHIERQVIQGLGEETGKAPEVADAVGLAFIEALYGEKAKDKKSRQALLLGWPEIRFMRREARNIVAASADREDAKALCSEYFGKDGIRRVFRAIRAQCAAASGFEAALYGRMITSDPEANIEGALHVAHAFTVHESEKDLDFITVVDDLKSAEDNSNAAGLFEAEITSGLYYGYAVVDVPTLVSNLTGTPPAEWLSNEAGRQLPAEVTARLIHLIATVSPGAKKGSTAPYSYAEAMVIEAGSRQPRTFSNAFRQPVPLRRGLGCEALLALTKHISGLDQVYGRHETRTGFSLNTESPFLDQIGASPLPLAQLSSWVKSTIVSGYA